MYRFNALVFFLGAWGSISLLNAAELSVQVTGIIDGDTIEVLHNQRPERIRLSGIDCPEKGQAFGKRAKQAASDLAFGKEVTLQTHGYDKYKRTLADVILQDGTNANHELVKEGWCWWYRKYAPGDTVLEGLETEARTQHRGVWAAESPMPPWEWRAQRRIRSKSFSETP
jgi:endonuclease YncB( thermonuclease family)